MSDKTGQIQVELLSYYGSDRAIAEAAWTSSHTKRGKDARSIEDVIRIVGMLAKEGHATPFEHTAFTFWMRIPIAIDRQLMTHRIASHSGMSGRYRRMPNDFLSMPEDVRRVADKMLYGGVDLYNQLCERANRFYEDATAEAKEQYAAKEISNEEYKRFREFIRGVLPQHNMTERVSTFNLRSLANFFRLRTKPNAQPEIQFLANEMLECVGKLPEFRHSLHALEQQEWRL